MSLHDFKGGASRESKSLDILSIINCYHGAKRARRVSRESFLTAPSCGLSNIGRNSYHCLHRGVLSPVRPGIALHRPTATRATALHAHARATLYCRLRFLPPAGFVCAGGGNARCPSRRSCHSVPSPAANTAHSSSADRQRVASSSRGSVRSQPAMIRATSKLGKPERSIGSSAGCVFRSKRGTRRERAVSSVSSVT